MPTTFVEGLRPSDWLKGEQETPLHFSRENVVVLAGSGAVRSVPSGTVIGALSASGKVKAIDFASILGDEDAAGIMLFDASAPDGADGEGVAIVRNAVIEATRLVWPAGATTENRNAALAQLAALGVVVRKGE